MTLGWLVPLGASARYEITMMLRSRMLWLAVIPLAGLSLLLAFTSQRGGAIGPSGKVADVAIMVNLVGGLGLAVAMADRFRWHRRAGLADLLTTTPGSSTARLTGMLAGSVAVALAPLAGVVLVYGIATGVSERSPAAVGSAFASVVLILVPGALLVSALAGLAGVVMPVTAARIGVAGLWGWATIFNNRVVPIPTVSYTVLSPAGGYPAVAWLGAPRSDAVLGGQAVGGAEAALNLLAVLVCTVSVLTVARIWTERYR